MTEIEKLYENAGIEGEWRDYRVKNGKVYEDKNPKNRNIRLCKPKFTAEKQLELIKWLASYGKYDQTRRLLLECIDEEWYIAFYEDLDLMSNGSEIDFKECLAKVINKLWQDLTEQEQQQIKEILQ